jgi:hypothetical protein
MRCVDELKRGSQSCDRCLMLHCYRYCLSMRLNNNLIAGGKAMTVGGSTGRLERRFVRGRRQGAISL